MPSYPVAYRKTAARYNPLDRVGRGIQTAVNDNYVRALPNDTRDYEKLLNGDLRRRLIARRAVIAKIARNAARARVATGVGAILVGAELADEARHRREQAERKKREEERRVEQSVRRYERLVPSLTPDWSRNSGWTEEFQNSDPMPWSDYPLTYWGSYTLFPIQYPVSIGGGYDSSAGATYANAESLRKVDYGSWDPALRLVGEVNAWNRPIDDPAGSLGAFGFENVRGWKRLSFNEANPFLERVVGYRPTEGDEYVEADDYVERGPMASSRPRRPIRERRNQWAIAVNSPTGAPPTHVSEPPGRNTRERKFRAQTHAAVRLVGDAFGSITELGDFVDSFWFALPKSHRSGFYLLRPEKDGKVLWGAQPRYRFRHKVSLVQKMADLFNGYDQIDMQAAIRGVILNQLIDAGLGKLGRKAQEAARPVLEAVGRPVGFGFGPGL